MYLRIFNYLLYIYIYHTLYTIHNQQLVLIIIITVGFPENIVQNILLQTYRFIYYVMKYLLFPTLLYHLVGV